MARRRAFDPLSLRLLSIPTFGLIVATLVPRGIFEGVSVVVITISSIRVARPRTVSLIHMRRVLVVEFLFTEA